MPTINLNQILLFMEKNQASVEEALQRFNIKEEDFSEATRAELQRQMELHNEAIQKEEQKAQGETQRIQEDYAGQE